MTTVEALIQFLLEGDIFGFIQACYLTGFQSLDILWFMISMTLTAPLYIRTKSLIYVCIAWMMLGSFIIVAMPIIAGVAILLWVLGVGGLLWKLYTSIRD